MSKEAMKLALEALEAAARYGAGGFEDAKDALREALTEQPAQQEPDWLDKDKTETDWDYVWLLIKAASYASSKGFISGTTNWGSAVSRYIRNESPQPAPATPVREQEPEIVERVRRWTGKTMRTARNPNITARECIELANWIAANTAPPQQEKNGDVL